MKTSKMIRDYFNNLADKIAATSQLAGVSNHNPDIGFHREELLRNFLNNHLPQRMQAMLGGSVIGFNGEVSKQIDIIVRADNTPRFEENQRSFIIAESLVSAITVKSKLDKAALFDSLDNLASIPQISRDIINFNLLKKGAFDDLLSKHPSTYIYAFDGLEQKTISKHLDEYLLTHPNYPLNRLPLDIVVHNKYIIKYIKKPSETFDGTFIPENTMYPYYLPFEMRGLPLSQIISYIYQYSSYMPYFDVNYHEYINSAFNPNKD